VVALTLGELLVSGKLAEHLAATLSRVALGCVLGGVPGLVLGLFMGWSRPLRVVVDPFVAAAHPVPKIAILPLVMIVLGIGELSRVVVVAVAAFFPMVISAMAGVRQISPVQFEVAENYGAGLVKVFTRVVLPGSLPLVLAGVRLAFNTALLITIALELVTAQRGLGAMVWLAWQTLRVEELYASVALIATLGIVVSLLLQHLTRRLVPWQADRES
jgi:NitT/TauT family transport system permease protein